MNNKYPNHDELEFMTALSELSLKALIEKRNVLVFPNSFQAGDDSQYVLSMNHNQEGSWNVQTYNLIGYIGRGNAEIKINSRFDVPEHYNFLHYLLLKTQNINLFDCDVNSNLYSSMFDLLKFLFPKYLDEAISSGLLKMYDFFAYDNSKLKGHIDVNRHIKNNLPFMGNIAYNLREHTCDNYIIHLVCYCIDYLQKDKIGRLLLAKDEVTKYHVEFVRSLGKSYRKNTLSQTLSKNLRTPIHPLYIKYRSLQKLCLALLLHRHISYYGSTEKVHGVLFDAAWLWEEYVALVIKDSYKHIVRGKGYKLFSDGTSTFQEIIPDFLSIQQEHRIVADAKYISLDDATHLSADRASAIYYKTIMYMYRFRANKGLLLYPGSKNSSATSQRYNIIDTDGCLMKIPMKISRKEDFWEFVEEMKLKEEEFLEEVRKRTIYMKNR